MKLILAVFAYIVSGVAFWIPSVVIHAIRGMKFGGSIFDVIAIFLLPVLAAVVALDVLDKLRVGGCRRGIIAIWMLVGIWILGPLMITVGASFSGGGFARPEAWRMLALAVPLFMHFTWMMSAYDGTLGAARSAVEWSRVRCQTCLSLIFCSARLILDGWLLRKEAT